MTRKCRELQVQHSATWLSTVSRGQSPLTTRPLNGITFLSREQAVDSQARGFRTVDQADAQSERRGPMQRRGMHYQSRYSR